MNIQTIKLAGQEFPVPPLAFRQIRVVTLAAQRLNSADLSALTDQNITDLFEMAVAAVQKGTATITRQALEDMHITVDELLAAKRTICEQAGMVFVQAGELPARS